MLKKNEATMLYDSFLFFSFKTSCCHSILKISEVQHDNSRKQKVNAKEFYLLLCFMFIST